ncbi:MAG: trigger factor [Deltaproteobacteria bacterium]|nr:MAG: trigger factor [Deltaproteobacteria bacterium]
MQVTVEDLSSVKKKICIEIPEADVTRELDSAYNNLKKTARIKGFRQGKAPRSVLERMYKKDVHSDVTGKLIQKSFADAVMEKKLNMVGEPEIDGNELEAGKAFTYEATLEIRPELSDVKVDGIDFKRTLYKVQDEEVDVQLQMLQKRLANKVAIEEDRPAAEGDFVLVSYEGTENGQAFEPLPAVENQVMRIGSATLSKDFDDALIGVKAGEEKTFSVSYPEDYINKNLAGHTIDFKAVIKEIREEKLPEIDDEMAKQLGDFETLDDVKKEIVNNLQQGYDRRQEQELQEQVYEALLEGQDFEVPEVMIRYEVEAIINDAERMLSQSNMTLDQTGKTREGLAVEYRDLAIKQVRRHLLLNKVIEQEKLALSEEDLDAGYNDMAASIGQPAEIIKQFYGADENRLDYFKHTLLEKKCINLIIEKGQVEEVEPDFVTPEADDNA